jgi:ethanolamine utilization protein EutA (predicted chaperonin)
MKMETTFSLSDSVLHRLVQVLQLAMITGTDIVDLLRQIRLQWPDNEDGTTVALALTPEYEITFKRMLDELEARANAIIAESKASVGVAVG